MNRLLSITLVCLLNVSLALASAFNLKVEVTPVGAGSLNTSGGTYEEGSSVRLSTSRNTGYVFKGWYEDDNLLSSSTSFYYTMPSQDATVQARYEYDPEVPGNPAMPDTTTYFNLSASISPYGAGSLNIYSGKYAGGASVYLNAYRNTGYRFLGWQDDEGKMVSEKTSFNYTMPHRDVQLTAMYSFDPDVPANPDSMATLYSVTLVCKPVGAGSFNTNKATAEEGGNVRLYAYTNTGYKFLRWEDSEGNTISTAQDFYYVMPHGNMQIFGVFDFDPEPPSNPAKNYWNKELDEVIVDDFKPNELNSAVRSAIGDSNADEVAMITVQGRMGNNDFGIANNYSNCTLLDLSRVTGVTEIPSYSFDYTKLESIYLPSTIEKIGYRAFYQCTQLNSINLYAMTPPELENQVFDGVPEGLVIYVPAAAIAQYQENEVWSKFTLMPIKEDIRNLTVQLPEGTDVSVYAQMWLELTNTKSGQHMHYVMTDRMSYTFANIIRNTEWNVVLRSQAGDVFGKIDNVEVKDDDVTITFTSLTRPQNVTLKVLAGNNDVTSQVQVAWIDADGNYLAQGSTLAGLPVGRQLSYRISLNQELAMAYLAPQTVEYTLKDGGNNIVCQLTPITQITISGRVKDMLTGQPVNGATVSASQTFDGRYSRTLNTRTNAQGQFTMSISQVPTQLAFAAQEYVSQTLSLESILDSTQTTLPDIALKSIVGATIGISFTYTASAASGTEAEVQEWYNDYQNVSFAIRNKTQGREISEFNVQYPQIVLLEEVADGDELSITATSRTAAFNPVTVACTIEEQRASAKFPIVELGRIEASFQKNENQKVVGMLYNANGKLLKNENYSNGTLSFSNLADGSYTLVTMGSSSLFNTIYDLSQLPETGLAQGSDYVQHTAEVKSGVVSLVSIEQVPTLDESKLYYTGDGTSFSVNKSSIVAGNYLTLTGRVDFKTAYASGVSNVQMIVDLPESCSFVENSVMVGNSTSSYTLNGQRLTIPLVRYTDRVRFCVIPTLGGNYAPSAFVQFDLNGQSIMQPIGSANYTAKDLSISVPSTVAKTTIPVSGTAIGKSTIEIFDNDVLIGQTTSLANGTWATTCELNEPYNLSRHKIMAKVTTAQGVVLQSENMDCFYDKNAIQVSKVMMYHENPEMRKTFALTFDFQNPMDKDENYIYYIYNKKFTFTINFTNNDPEVVSDVILYVKTAKSGWHPLTATYDAKQDIWVAAGEFGNMYDGDLPVNVSVDFTCNTKQYLDSKQINEAGNDIEEVSKDYFDAMSKLKDLLAGIGDSITDDQYQALCDSMGIDYDTSYNDDSFTIDTTGWSQEQIEEYLDSCAIVMEAELKQLQDQTAAYDKWFEIPKQLEEVFGNGATYNVGDCSGLTPELLIQQGYEAIETTEGTFIYILTNDEEITMVIFEENLRISVKLPANMPAELRAKLLKKAPLPEKFSEIYGWIAQARELVNTIYQDFLRRLMVPEQKLMGQIESLQKYIAKCERYLRMCNNGSARWKYWNGMIKDAKATLATTRTVLRFAKPLLRFIARCIPIADYLVTLNDCYATAEELAGIYYSIPDPCPNDQANANWCMVEDVSIAVVVGGMAIADVVAEITGDCEIAGGAAAAVATGGTSLAVTGWGLVKKIAAQIGKCCINLFTQKVAIKHLKNKVAELRCNKKDSDPKPDAPGHHSGNNDKKFGIDPSGFVYEGVFSNRVEGATATVFYKEMVEDMYGDLHENIVKWDAEEYAQENPLFTDENGYYRWDVPTGLWQVKFEKEGYETTYSEWLPVPPPQLDINIAMTQNVQPTVLQARAYEDAVEVEFDKYMMPESLTVENISILQGETPVEGSIQLLNEEVSYEGQTDTYASRIRFNAAQPFTANEITLVVKNRVQSYAGIRMQDDFMQKFTVEREVKQILCDSVTVVTYGETSTLKVSVLPALASAGHTLHVATSSDMMLSLENDAITIAEDGTATITITGELPGTAALTFTVSDSKVTATSIVNIEQRIILPTVSLPTSNIASGSKVDKGTEVILSCETEGAIIYYTLDGSCPCDETATRFIYDGTPIIINDSVTIRVMATAEGMGESDVVEFTYTVDKQDGIADVSLNGKIRIYPLPVRDRLNVTAGGRIIRNVSLCTLSGSQVARVAVNTTHVVIDVSHIAPGIYLVNVMMEDETISRKIVKVE